MRWIRRSVLLQQTLSHMPSHVCPGVQERKEYEDKANEAKVNAYENAPARGMCFSDSPLHESSLHSIGVIHTSYILFLVKAVLAGLDMVYLCCPLRRNDIWKRRRSGLRSEPPG